MKGNILKWTLELILVVMVIGCGDISSAVNNSTQGIEENVANAVTLREGFIHVHGEVVHPLELNLDSLKNMQAHAIENYKIVNHTGEVKRTIANCRGILLRDILDKAHIDQRDAKDRNFAICIKAPDGYMATFSWAELFNNPTGDSTYIIFEEMGNPIAERGPFVLITMGDKITGVRHVYLVNEVLVKRM